jgi:dynein heavy chain, axonemal
LKSFKVLIDEGSVPEINWKEIRSFFQLPYFNPEDIEKKNSAAAGLCAWVINIVNYYDIVQMVEPKREALRQANESLTQANEALLLVRERLHELQARMDFLTLEFQNAESQRIEALTTAENGKLKLELARRLLSALGSEKTRWTEGVEKIKEGEKYLIGNCLLAASCVSYLGPFTKKYRETFISETLLPLLSKGGNGKASKILTSHHEDPLRFIVSESDIAKFQTQGLPADSNSSDNASILLNSARSPLLIDPQLQALSWIKEYGGSSLMIGRMGQKDLFERLFTAMETGKMFLIENIGDSIDSSLLPIIFRQTIRRNNRHYLVLGQREVELSPHFRLVLHTKLSNPHYPPEIHAEATIVNFSVTQTGLEEQLLSMVVKYERSDLATQRAALFMQQNLFMIKVQHLEDSILLKLSDATGDITENRPLIEELELSKRLSKEIAAKLEESRVTSEKLMQTSEKYRPVARRGALIFFAMSSLQKLHAYYMYSLRSFLQFFFLGISLPPTAGQRPQKSPGLRSIRSQYSLAMPSSPGPVASSTKSHNHNHNNISYDKWIENDTKLDHFTLEELGQQIIDRGHEIDEKDRQSQDLDISERIVDLQQSVTIKILDFLKVGLFEEDKLLVSTLIALRILADEGSVEREYINALIRCRAADDPPPKGEEMSRWMSDVVWSRLRALEEDLARSDPKFENLTEKIALDIDEWEEWHNAVDIETRAMPGDFKEISSIQQLLIVLAMRPDKLAVMLTTFLRFHLGEEFVAQNPFHLPSIYQYASARSPILFILHPGTDPTEWIEKLAHERHMVNADGSARFLNISMGQGQEDRANESINRLCATGGWIFLQNVHLMQSWLPKLEDLLEAVQPHADFRLFLSTESPPIRSEKNIPEGLLISCVTVSNEPPSDLKANLSRAWASIDVQRIESSPVQGTFKACLFGLCFFHSIILGRRRFGSQGWTRSYGFNMGDLKICVDVLESYLMRGQNTSTSPAANIIPWRDLQYLFGEIMYGGHITDFFDRRVNMTYLSAIFQERLLKKGELAPKLFSPDSREFDHEGYRSFIETSLPVETPSIYGLHPNADIRVLTSRTEVMFGHLLGIEFGASNGRDASSKISYSAKDLVLDLLKRMPDQFNLADLIERSQEMATGINGPYTTVLIQECTRFNAVTSIIVSSLLELQKGLLGQLNMSAAMEQLAECLLLNVVPGRMPWHKSSWEKLAWMSKKSLSSWFHDILARRKQLEVWSSTLRLPASTCLPYLINPMALLTAIKQVTARKLNLPLDSMTITTHVTRMTRATEASSAGHVLDDGILVHGLLIEGARWSDEDEVVTSISLINEVMCGGQLCDSRPKQLLTPMPIIYLQAVRIDESWTAENVGYLRNDASVYDCPVYTTTDRGPSFVFLSNLTTVSSNSKWILAGVALIMQSDD